ncbi:hypothetical protein KKE06_05250 [Candidatus Micrarchaeota archaeon]|nr:hypothetical protein [Candidatus Micrarchaeota archaeon]MBU1929946.1 hypothetical protein [Candidatus Micrarchaeota archaeon]
MARYTEDQKRIAMLLLHESKTAEELNTQLSIPYNQLLNELKAMIKIGVLKKQDGFPTSYALKKDIALEVQRREKLAETDSNKLRFRAIIEMQAVEPELLKKQATKLGESLKKDSDFTLYNFSQAPTLKQEESYSTFLDLTLSVKDFKTLVRFMYFYGPSSLEVLKPSRFEIDANDLQEGLMDMAQMINRYSQYLTKLLNRSELEELNKRLLR